MSSFNVGKASKPLKIFFHAVPDIGHQNACVGIAQPLLARGHKVFFLLNETSKGQFSKFGFEEILLTKPLPPQALNAKVQSDDADATPANPIKQMSATLITSGLLSAKNPLDKMKDQLAAGLDIFKDAFGSIHGYNGQMEEAIQREKPDLLVLDSFVIPPAFQQAACPWVFLCSAQPLSVFRSYGKLPPYGAGFATNSDPSTWEEYFPVLQKYLYEIFGGRAQEEIDAAFNFTPKYPINDGLTLFANSPYLNIYGYPQELDYSDVFQIPDNFACVDAFIRDIPEPFELPKEVTEMRGEKLIYFSLGSMGSVDVELMKRVTTILGRTNYKVIVSKGPLADEYELPDNCWGESFLPQTRILPLVDLVITHGGNNTVTESFSLGKPMIVLPLFGDQYDSAQRLHELGYGIRLDAYTFTDNQLFEAIDKLLNDCGLYQRLQVTSERMASSNSKLKVCKRLEQEVEKFQANQRKEIEVCD